MFFGTEKYWDELGKFILKLSYPHEENDYQPWLLQSHGLLFFLLLIIISQTVINVTSRSGQVLGFATNISVSEVINLTNEQRTLADLVPLKTNAALNKAAALKAEDMFEKNYWDHFAPDGTSPWYFFGLVGYQYTWAGENLARDFATSAGVVAAWMDSVGHRANILNPNFNEIGVAVVNGNLDSEDTTLVVQLFGRPVGLVASAPQASEKSKEGVEAEAARVGAEISLPSSEKETTPISPSGQEKVSVSPSGSGLSGSSLPLLSLVKNSTNSQKVTLSLLLLIGLLFVFDSLVIFRKRHTRTNSHSLSHASMILLLIAITLFYGRGAIL
ncbi:MAG TPA: CAP domain-containing protein [Candidatus Nanoarchaeia archaeon]